MKEPARSGQETWQRDDGSSAGCFFHLEGGTASIFLSENPTEMKPKIIIKERRNRRIKENPSGRKSFFFVSKLPLLGFFGSLHCWSLILK